MRFFLLFLIAIVLSVLLVHAAEAKKYTIVDKTTFVGDLNCILQKTGLNEIYYRASDNFANPANNNNHDRLLVKGEVDLGLQKTITQKGTFDLDKWQKKYHATLKVIREYIEVYNGDKNIIKNDYLYKNFDKKRTQYTFAHVLDFGC